MNLRRLLRAIFFLATSSAMIGCAHQNPLSIDYKEGNNVVGFYDCPIRNDAYEVTYIGEQDSNPKGASFGAFVRGSEIALACGEKGFATLVVNDRLYTFTVYIPAQYTTIMNSYTDSNGNTRTTTQQIMIAPERWETHTFPMTTLIIRPISKRSGYTVDAMSMVRQAKLLGLKLSPSTLELLEATVQPSTEPSSHSQPTTSDADKIGL